MSGLYDRLMDHIGDDDDDDKPAGMTPLEIAELPDDQRRVMFWMLRNPQATANGLTPAVLESQFGDIDNLPDILTMLTRENWLILQGEPPNQRYKVNLRRKRGSKLGSNLWSSLTNRLVDDSDAGESDSQTKRKGSSGMPALSDW